MCIENLGKNIKPKVEGESFLKCLPSSILVFHLVFYALSIFFLKQYFHLEE